MNMDFFNVENNFLQEFIYKLFKNKIRVEGV